MRLYWSPVHGWGFNVLGSKVYDGTRGNAKLFLVLKSSLYLCVCVCERDRVHKVYCSCYFSVSCIMFLRFWFLQSNLSQYVCLDELGVFYSGKDSLFGTFD